VAKVRQSQNDVKTSLFDALNNVNLDQRKFATGVYQNELNADEQRRQFEETQAAARRAAAQAAAGSGGLASLFGVAPSAPGGAPAQAAAPKPVTDKLQQLAFNDVMDRIRGNANAKALMSDYQATAASARNGNKKDLYKLQIYRQYRPDLFAQPFSWEAKGGKYIDPATIANSGSLRF
jgi:hypothetical protein